MSCIVTARVLDPSGNVYANALVIASFVGQSTTPGSGPYVTGGVPQGQFQLIVPSETDSNGNLSMQITGNDTITPQPSQWRFTCVSDTTPSVSFSVLITISGTTQDISAALQAASASLAVAFQPGTVTGNLGITGTLAVTGLSNFHNLENIRFADQFVSINAAVTDAGTTGAVIVPPNYAGTDIAQANSVPTMDFRQNNQAAVSFYHGVKSMFPTQSDVNNIFPAGHDFGINCYGPADLHLSNNQVDFTSTTSIVGPGTNTITVGAGSSPNGGPSGTTSILSHATSVSLVLEPETVNEETVANANWSIVDGTHLSVTTTLNHTQPYTVRQQGVLIIDGRVMRFSPPTGALSYQFWDGNNNPIVKLPANTGGTFPNSAWQWSIAQTGALGGTSNETHRNATSSSVWVMQNSAATASILQISEASGAGVLTMGNPTNNSLQIQASSDIPRLFFGGTTNGAIFYASRGGTGTSGTIFFRNNSTDDSPKVQIGTGATPSISIFGSTSGASTVNAPATGGVISTLPTTAGTLGVIVASGTATLTANATLGATTSQTAVTVAATGAATTDAIEWSYASAPGAGDSLCIVSPYVTANNVNFVRSNPTAAAQNVSAIVINWRVIR
jgi:hypothetical protein